MKMRTGDLKPDLDIELSNENKSPFNALDATSINIVGQRDGVTVITRTPDEIVFDGTNSVISMLWQIGDTTEVGTIRFEVEVIWPGGKPQTIRTQNNVFVSPDFG